MDAKKVPGSDCASIKEVRFSPDGKRYAADCETPARRSHVTLIDGRRGQEYDSITYMAFTPDSSTAVYVARSGMKDFLVFGDQESDGYASIGHMLPEGHKTRISVTAKGTRYAFGAKVSNDACVFVIDGKATALKGHCADEVTFRPDGTRCAYVGAVTRTLVVDGVPTIGTFVKSFKGTMAEGKTQLPISFLFSPNSKHVVYMAGLAGQPGSILGIDGKYIPVAQGIVHFPTFTPDSRHFIFATPVLVQGQPVPAFLGIYVDGRLAARFNGANSSLLGHSYGWEMGADGVLTFLVQDGADIKRVRITPPDETSIDTMLAEARPIPRGR